MSQFASLSEAEIEDRFHITGQRPVQFMLTGYAREAEPFTVQFDDGSDSFLTLLLAVRPEKQELIVDCSGSPEQNRRFLASERHVFVARPDGIHVQFACGAARDTRFEGRPAFALRLPPFVVRLQRREFFRIETGHARPVQFHGQLPGGTPLKLSGHDLSVAGIGLNATGNLPEMISQGMTLGSCRIELPEDETPLFVEATVRHLTALSNRQGTTWRFGLRFDQIARPDENRVQRYIAQIEHERRELS